MTSELDLSLLDIDTWSTFEDLYDCSVASSFKDLTGALSAIREG